MKFTLKPLWLAALTALLGLVPVARAQWTSQYTVIYLPGNFNGYDTSDSAMRLVSNNTWQAYVTLTNFNNPQFLFSNYPFDNPPATNAYVWKETNQPLGSLPLAGTAERNVGNDISLTGVVAGYLRVLFNDVSGAYRVENVTAGTPPAECWINEIHYDNSGTDANEGIEIAGPAGRSLIGYNLVLYNGGNGLSYQVTSLSGTLANQGGGIGTKFFAYPQDGLQNGSPDGVALVRGTSVVQFLSYEGPFAAVNGTAAGLTSTDIGIEEGGGSSADYSLQLTGVGNSYSNFTWTGPVPNSRGNINSNQLMLGGPTPASLIISNFTTAPVVPMTGQSLSVSAYISSTNGASNISATVFYRIGNASSRYLPLAMTNSGTLYTAVSNIPPQAAGTIIRYYLFVNFSGPGTNTPTLVPADAPTTTRTTGYSTIPFGTVWINEINVQNDFFYGQDQEFVEIAGVAGASLNGWQVELLLANGTPYALYTITNNFLIANEYGGFGFHVYGDSGVSGVDSILRHADFSDNNHIADAGGVRLYDAFGLLWDAVWYGPSTSNGFTYAGEDWDSVPSGDGDLIEASLGLTGTGSNAAGFVWTTNETVTAGSLNENQTLTGGNTNPVPPYIICPADVFLPCTNSAIPAAAITNVVSTGFCGNGSVTVTWAGDVTNSGNGCRGNPKIVTRTYKSVSACASTNLCTQLIVVEDTNAPSLTTPSQTLTNSSFEAGSMFGWTLTGNVTNFTVNALSARTGVFHGFLPQPQLLKAEDAISGIYDGGYIGGCTRAQAPATTSLQYSVQFDGTSGYVETPTLNLYNDAMTIAGWARRNGDQSTFAGIVYCRTNATTAGFHFTTNNYLGYTWNGAATTYEWQSGIVMPNTQWCYVALTILPTQAVLYMRTTSTWFIATNKVTHGVEEFNGPTSIGRDPIGSRLFKGWLDDIQFYATALSYSEITGLWNNARGGVTALGCLARYSFDDNPPGGQQTAFHQDLTAASGQVWTAGAWMKNDPTSPLRGTNEVTIAVQFLNATNGVITNFNGATKLTSSSSSETYTRLIARGTAPVQTAKARVRIQYQQDAAIDPGNVFVDDVLLSPMFVSAGSGIGQCGVMPNFLTNTALITSSDGCGGTVTLTQSPAAGSVFSNANQVVTITASDPCGNVSVGTFTVYVDDTTAPLIFNVLPSTTNQSCASLVTATFSTFDNCPGGLVYSLVASYTNFGEGCPFSPRVITNVYRVTDMGGNTKDAAQVITLSDNVKPVSTVAVPSALTNGGFEAGSAAGWNTFGTYVLVPTNQPRTGARHLRLNGDTNAPANYTGLYQDLTNVSPGEVWTLLAWVLVPTNEAPGTGCRLETKIEFLDGNGNYTGTFYAPHVTNGTERGIYQPVYVSAAAPSSTAKVRGTLVYIQTNSQPGAVLVDDLALSRFVLPATNGCDATMSSLTNLVTASDCGNVSITQTPEAGSPITTGTNSVRLLAADNCQNITTNLVTFYVVDVQPPVILSAPTNLTVATTNAVPLPDAAMLVSTDFCSAATNLWAGDSNNGGAGTTNNPLVITRRYIAVDAWGNIAQTQQTITVASSSPSAPTNVQIRAVAFSGGTNLVIQTLGTNTWSVRVEYTTNLVGVPTWWILTNFNNNYVNGTNTTSFPMPTNVSPPTFLRVLQTYP